MSNSFSFLFHSKTPNHHKIIPSSDWFSKKTNQSLWSERCFQLPIQNLKVSHGSAIIWRTTTKNSSHGLHHWHNSDDFHFGIAFVHIWHSALKGNNHFFFLWNKCLIVFGNRWCHIWNWKEEWTFRVGNFAHFRLLHPCSDVQVRIFLKQTKTEINKLLQHGIGIKKSQNGRWYRDGEFDPKLRWILFFLCGLVVLSGVAVNIYAWEPLPVIPKIECNGLYRTSDGVCFVGAAGCWDR